MHEEDEDVAKRNETQDADANEADAGGVDAADDGESGTTEYSVASDVTAAAETDLTAANVERTADEPYSVGAEAASDGDASEATAERSNASDAEPAADDMEPIAEDAAADVDERLIGILESVLFACGEPITLGRLVEVVAGPTRAELRAALAALAARTEQERRGIRLLEVAGGWQFRTAPEHAEWVRRLFQQRPWRLTRATLETLAIVAYKQPITRAEVEAIRSVDVDSVLASLLARKLVKIVGRKDVIGRPLLYGTTRQFLEVFGLRDLTALPGLSEVAGAMPESVAAGAAASDENTWSTDDGQDQRHTPAETAGGLGDVLPPGGGDVDSDRPGDGERHDGQDPGDAGASD